MTISDSWLRRPRGEGGSSSVEQQSFGFSGKGSYELLGPSAKSKKLMEPQILFSILEGGFYGKFKG